MAIAMQQALPFSAFPLSFGNRNKYWWKSLSPFATILAEAALRARALAMRFHSLFSFLFHTASISFHAITIISIEGLDGTSFSRPSIITAQFPFSAFNLTLTLDFSRLSRDSAHRSTQLPGAKAKNRIIFMKRRRKRSTPKKSPRESKVFLDLSRPFLPPRRKTEKKRG